MADEKQAESLPPSFEDEDKPQAISVELPDESAGITVAVEGEGEQPAQEAEPEAKPEPKKHPKKATQRINELWHKDRENQGRIAELQQRLEQSEHEKAQLANRAMVVDRAALDTHEQRYLTQLASAKKDYAAAVAEQDGTKMAEATESITEAKGELQNIRAFKMQHPVPEAPRPQPRQNGNGQEQPVQQQEIPPTMAAWVEENPYLMPNTPEYDPEMHAAAARLADLLDQRYRRQGRQEDIGTTDYFVDLTGEMQREFPEYEGWEGRQEPPPQSKQQQMRRTIPMSRNGSGVAPVSRQQAGGTAPANGARTVVLSPKEQAMAQKMIGAGSYRYPAGHAQAGKPMNEADGMRYHARFVAADRAEQAAKKESM